eukprot:gb/GEZN01000594.1/.p1 GENE.gb/GEZN01000594.1/~~gb/GEZN01000594.1/.p1  ORF type:complete len:1340 (-),score=384.36 gb/GEZN01000594.1/:40-3783(-)
MLKRDEAEGIFGNAEDLAEFHTNLLKQLQTTLDHWTHHTCVAPMFLQISAALDNYTQYIGQFHSGMENLKKHKDKNKKLLKFVEDQQRNLETQARENKGAPGSRELSALMITPIQRLPRYSLLLKELLKSTIPEHMDFKGLKGALDDIDECTRQLNERKWAMDNRARMKEIAALIGDYEGLLDAPDRRLLFEAPLTYYETENLGVEEGDNTDASGNSTNSVREIATSDRPSSGRESNELTQKQKKGKACIMFGLSDMVLLVRVKKKKLGGTLWWRFFKEFEMIDCMASAGINNSAAGALAKRLDLDSAANMMLLSVDEERLFFSAETAVAADNYVKQLQAAQKEASDIKQKAFDAERELRERPEVERKAKEQKLAGLEDEIRLLSQELEAARAAKAEAMARAAGLEAVQEAKAKLTAELAERRAVLETEQNNSRRLKTEVDSLCLQLSQANAALARQRIQEEEEKQATSKERAAKQAELVDLRAELAAARQSSTVSTGEMSSLLTAKTRLETQFATLSTELAEAKQQTITTQKQMDQLNQELTESQKESSRLQVNLTNSQEQNRQTLQQAKETLQLMEALKKSNEEEVQRSKKREEKLEQNFSVAKEEVAILTSRLQEKLRQEEEKKKEEKVAKQAEQMQASSELSVLQARVASLTQELGKANEEAQASATALESRTTQLNDAKLKLQAAAVTQGQLSKEIQQAKAAAAAVELQHKTSTDSLLTKQAELEAFLATALQNNSNKGIELSAAVGEALELRNQLEQQTKKTHQADAAAEEKATEQQRNIALIKSDLEAAHSARARAEEEAKVEAQRRERELARETNRWEEEKKRLNEALQQLTLQEERERKAAEEAMRRAREEGVRADVVEGKLETLSAALLQAEEKIKILGGKATSMETRISELEKEKMELAAGLSVAHARVAVAESKNSCSSRPVTPTKRGSFTANSFANPNEGNDRISRPPSQELFTSNSHKMKRVSSSGKPPKFAGTLIQRVDMSSLQQGESGLKCAWKRVHVVLSSSNLLQVHQGKDGREILFSMELRSSEWFLVKAMDGHYDKPNCFEIVRKPGTYVADDAKEEDFLDTTASGLPPSIVFMAMTSSKLNEWLSSLGKILGTAKVEKRYMKGLCVYRSEERVEVEAEDAMLSGGKKHTTWVKWKKYYATLDSGRLSLSLKDDETGEIRLVSDIPFKSAVNLVVKAAPVAQFSKPFCLHASSNSGDSVVLMLMSEKEQKAWIGAFHALISDAKRGR